MKELKTYISEGFFNNVGANNIVKPVIDTIKDASIKELKAGLMGLFKCAIETFAK